MIRVDLDFKNLAIALLAIACLGLAMLVDHYRDKATLAATKLASLQQQVNAQNDNAARALKTLTDQRDAKQLLLDAAYQQQEQQDAANTLEIARLNHELGARPVRVRIVAQPAACGPGGGSAASDTATSTNAGAADAAAPYGLLPDANSRRLGAVIAEIETLSAAYASCRGQLMNN